MGVDAALREQFQQNVQIEPRAAKTKELGDTLKPLAFSASSEQRLDVAASLAHVAFAAPERIGTIYDAFSAGWCGKAIDAKPLPSLQQAPLETSEDLWREFWQVVEDAVAGKLDAASITARTAALGAHLSPSFADRAIQAAHLYPGVTEAAAGPLPSMVDLGHLAACPNESLGRQFHDLIVDNNFDLEVLDREAIGLAALPKPLDYLNTRILQSHDLWHIVGGYEITALHEIAISAFQMAQFGHNYSSQFLAVTATVGAISPPEGWGVLMDTITSAWVHGRETAPLITIPWEDVWTLSTEEIRGRYAIAPYQSPYPANLIEELRAA